MSQVSSIRVLGSLSSPISTEQDAGIGALRSGLVDELDCTCDSQVVGVLGQEVAGEIASISINGANALADGIAAQVQLQARASLRTTNCSLEDG